MIDDDKALVDALVKVRMGLAGEVKSLIRRYGTDAVRDTAARLTKPRVRDRLMTADFRQLQPFIETEAWLFLENKKRTAHPKIADAVLVDYRVHSEEADHRRIMKRLASPEWKFRVLVVAFELAQSDYPVLSMVKVCRAGLSVPAMAALARLELDSIRADADRLSHRIGEVPLTMTRKQLADEAKVTTIGMLGKLASGLLSQPASGVTNVAFRDMSLTVENKSQDRQPKAR